MFPRNLLSPSRKAAVAVALIAALTCAAPVASAGSPRKANNTPPTISGTPPASVVAGATYDFVPTAYDADGNKLSFRIRNKPAWASFSSSTGELRGTPTTSDVGSYTGIEIRVSDGKATATLPRFDISVTSAAPVANPPSTNHPPVISGVPVTSAQADQPYAFQPSASDADGDPLTFSIQNKPTWATFDAANGSLYGTPTSSDVATFSNIVISVSDGQASASLAPFSITVAAAPTSSVTLQWTAPTTNTDGSAMTDLAGFKVFYGSSPGAYSASLDLPDPSMSSVVIEGLTAGTWYFSVKSVNSAGVESDYSPAVSKSL